VDKQGNTVDFLLTAKRDGRAARRFFTRAVNNRLPKIVNIDKSGANNAGIKDYNRKHRTKVVIRQCKYLNNIVEQDHRGFCRVKATRASAVTAAFRGPIMEHRL
jgi:putative transposase